MVALEEAFVCPFHLEGRHVKLLLGFVEIKPRELLARVICAGIYEFSWDDETHVAKLISLRENKLVKYKWMDDEPYHFEMEIIQDELTNDVALAITDFAWEETLDDRKLIWDNQIEYLQSVIGA